MKKLTTLVFASLLGGFITLGGYKYFIEDEITPTRLADYQSENSNSILPVSNTNLYGTNADFTEAAEKTVHAVVHVKNVAVYKGPRNIWEFYQYGNSEGRALQGAGSGVIITPDGYIVTNNHVIKGASELEVTLNNNQTYKAEVVGSDPSSDIALIKINAEDLDYIPFGDSNNIELGEWVLAVGNPFNLRSTVTAGIVSAKARDLNARDNSPQSFIQTDAAVNPGNSGGALVNINGELVGINTAISSPNGSYIGYSFAVPSNNARKIVEDIMEYGDVQEGILGIRGGSVTQGAVEEFGLSTSQGVFVGGVTEGSGAAKAGIRERDVITKIDNINIRKFSDLTGYIKSKRPGDEVSVRLIRDGEERDINVKLTKLETLQIAPLGIEVMNTSTAELKKYNTSNGVKISRTLDRDLPAGELVGAVIIAINDQKVTNINDVQRIMDKRRNSEMVVITYVDKTGERQKMIWR